MLNPFSFSQQYDYEEVVEKIEREIPDVEVELAEHLSLAMAENATHDIESDAATKGSKNVETLCKAYSQLKKSETEQLKLQLQIAEAQRRQMINWDSIIPKLFGVVVYGLGVVFWLCMERSTPVPMRLVRMGETLTSPRGL